MKTIVSILFFFFIQFGFSQTKIKLKSPTKMQEDYQTVNISDTTLVKIWHNEDMGSWYGHCYELKTKVPNGQYEIYIDDTLRLNAFIKDFQKDSIWTMYYPNGRIFSITTYIAGKRNGKETEYYQSGAILRQGILANDCPINDVTDFYENGKIQAKFYYENCVYIKLESYDENGEIKFIYDPITRETFTK